MKKILSVFLLITGIIPFFALSANAYSDDTAQSVAQEAGADELESDYLTADELNGDKNINIFEKVFAIAADAIKGNGGSALRSFGAVLAVVLLSCLMHAMKFGESEALNNAGGYISLLALSGVTYNVFYNLFIYIIASMETLNLAMSTLMPIMATLHVLGGTPAAGAASGAGLTLFLTVLSNICTKVLLPMLRICFALCLSGAMPGSVNLSGVTNFVKNTLTTLMAFIFTLLGFTLYLQTSVASASDNYITRSVRFASGVFVPVIGGMLGDASRTVIASVSIVKGTVGAAGVVMILSAVLPPLIAAIFYKLLLLGCGIVAKTLGCERESAFLYDLGGVISVLLALVAGAGAVCIIAAAVFVKTGVSV